MCNGIIIQVSSTKRSYKVITLRNNSILEFFHKDCLSGIKDNIKKNSIDVVVTSPPYNIGINYNTYLDNCLKKDILFG